MLNSDHGPPPAGYWQEVEMSEQHAFGPNGPQVARFIERLTNLTSEQLQELNTLQPFWVDD